MVSLHKIYKETDIVKILIGYCTTEGQTRKIGRFLMLQLANAGHAVELLEINPHSTEGLLAYDRVILLASIHVSHFQKSMTEFMAKSASLLESIPTMFISVSLAAVGHKDEYWKELDTITGDVYEATGLHPDCTVHVAGAYSPSKYDIFRRFIMRRIIAKEAPNLDPDIDHEFTDYDVLKKTVMQWIDK